MKLLEQINLFLQDAEKKGGVKGINFNAIVIPTCLLDTLEKEMEENPLTETTPEERKKNKICDLEVLICDGEEPRIRLGMIWP